jgi:hypothetical protein
MDTSIKELETKRKSLYQELSGVGDFLRGTISINFRKCGKKNCACSRPGHPGHGPQYLWNATIKGKSYAKSLKLGPELKKVTDETANYKYFQKLCEEIIQINEEICKLRPVKEADKMNEDETEELKKKLQTRFRKKSEKK